jgi:hypothetical protein
MVGYWRMAAGSAASPWPNLTATNSSGLSIAGATAIPQFLSWYLESPVMITKLMFRIAFPCVLALSCVMVASNLQGQVAAVVGQVSQSSYQDFHLSVESMGLGLYGGSAYNQGVRNRDGWAGAGSLGNQEARLFLMDAYTSMGLNVSTQGVYRNVVAELPGLTNPDRIFIIGGHYDHVSGDRPGGDDNASGTAGVLEAARVLSQYTFDSTIRFIGFNAEEDGLLGSKNYVNNQVIPNSENIVGVVNLDMILRPAWDSGNAPIDLDLSTRTSHAPSVSWAQAYQQAAATYVPSLQVDSTVHSVNGASDHDSFVTAGYPAFLAAENRAQEIWGGSNAYYHGPEDASDRLANNPNSPSGVTYDFAFATDVVRGAVALIAQEAGLILSDPCDFTADGTCDIADLNSMLQVGPVAPGVIVVPGVNSQFDLSGDGVINNDDVDEWLAMAATENGLLSPYRRGDADLSGAVDGTDFNLWNSAKFTSTLLWNAGDFTGDGTNDGSDFNQWNSNKFTTSDVTAVPEPTALTILLVGSVVFRRWRRHRSLGRMQVPDRE